MKNTPENKAKFFANYWGQKILIDAYGTPFVLTASHLKETSEGALRFFLRLKPLSQITDEDADFCLKEMGIPYRDDIVYNASKFRRVVLDKRMRTIDAATVDHLRSKGYALPWMGISVEEQIEFGWIKYLSQ